uniref:Uncharacterized protein n=1 Tax=Rhizophora mucronata TaxID=61149 RepID=A0A2P2NHS1_RHIMU
MGLKVFKFPNESNGFVVVPHFLSNS